jgi:hypothetical protein
MTESQPEVFDPVPKYGRATRVRRPVPSLVAALGIVVVYVVLQFVWLAVAALYNWAAGRFAKGIVQELSFTLMSLRPDIVPMIVILTVGFLFFWGVAPIHSALRLGQAIVRGVWAAVVSGIIVGIALVIQSIVELNSPPFSTYGPPSLHSILRGSGEAIVEGASSFAQTAAFIVLGAVILWNWMRVHPRSMPPVEAPVGSPADAPVTV